MYVDLDGCVARLLSLEGRGTVREKKLKVEVSVNFFR